MRSLLLLVLAACGAATTAVPSLPSQGGPAWTELTSQHFVVWTDGTPQQGRVLVKTMEHLRQVIYGVSYFNETTDTRIFVVALQNLEEVRAYIPEQFVAMAFDARNPMMQPLIVLPIDRLDADRATITHELTHAISYGALHRQAHWFSEGIATYFETLRIDEAGGKLDVGVPQDHRVRTLKHHRPTPIAQVFACNAPRCMDGDFYATVWLFFAYLMNKHPEELLHYMQLLAAAPEGDPVQQLAASVPTLPLDKIDDEIANWFAYGQTRVSRYTVAFKDYPIELRPLADGDALAARGLLQFLLHHDGPLPPAIATARTVDPTNVVASLVVAMHDRSFALADAKRLVAAHTDDWRAWWLLGLAAQHGPEARDARQEICALIVKNPGVLPAAFCPTK